MKYDVAVWIASILGICWTFVGFFSFICTWIFMFGSQVLGLSTVSYRGRPDCLIREPAGVTLVETVIVGCLQLIRRSHYRAVLGACRLRFFISQAVATHDGPVVEHNTWREKQVLQFKGEDVFIVSTTKLSKASKLISMIENVKNGSKSN